MVSETIGNREDVAKRAKATMLALRALDPCTSLAAAIGWTVCALMVMIAALTGFLTMRAARGAIQQEIGQLYAGHAQRLIDTIDANLAGRRRRGVPCCICNAAPDPAACPARPRGGSPAARQGGNLRDRKRRRAG